jgi:hypothetical protein
MAALRTSKVGVTLPSLTVRSNMLQYIVEEYTTLVEKMILWTTEHKIIFPVLLPFLVVLPLFILSLHILHLILISFPLASQHRHPDSCVLSFSTGYN